MSRTEARNFLIRHSMEPEAIDPAECAAKMLKAMEKGLAGKYETMPMIPTYLKNDGCVPLNKSAIVIDAGGTNFRSALVSFGEEGCRVEAIKKAKMPGTGKPVSWDEFIKFTADSIEPFTGKADKIGFCFSYNAEITPDIDGRVVAIGKEVEIPDAFGKLIGASLVAELERRGIKGKRVVILNDTVAVLLGVSAVLDKNRYSGFIGQVSGTGTNTCCCLPYSRIKKLGRDEKGSILINLESGMYDGMPRGDFDMLMDKKSNEPGTKFMEKMTAGAYLGELCRMMLQSAAEEGLLSSGSAARIAELGKIDASYVDAWAAGEKLEQVSDNDADGEFAKELSCALFERSARCMCSNILAIMLLTGEGGDEEKPVCVCAEGSLVQKSRCYRPMLERFLKEYGTELGRHAVMVIGNGSTLSGSAAAALLN